MRTSEWRGLCAAAVLTFLFASCGDSSTSKTDISTTPDQKPVNTELGGTGDLAKTEAGKGTERGVTPDRRTADVPPTDADCAKLKLNECRQCCADRHTAGQKAYDAAYTTCVCVKETCKDQCSQSVCATPANPGPTPSCKDCLDKYTAAGAKCAPSAIKTACASTPDCAAYTTCTSACK